MRAMGYPGRSVTGCGRPRQGAGIGCTLTLLTNGVDQKAEGTTGLTGALPGDEATGPRPLASRSVLR